MNHRAVLKISARALILSALSFCAGAGASEFERGSYCWIGGVREKVVYHEGVPCVSVWDIAEALRQDVVTFSSRGYTLVPPAKIKKIYTTNSGIIGETLHNGEVAFTARRLVRTERWGRLFRGGASLPSAEGDDLVVILCRLRNVSGHSLTVSPLGTSASVTTQHRTYPLDPQLADFSSFPPVKLVEGKPALAWSITQPIGLPADSDTDFNLVFSMPRDETVATFTYGLRYSPSESGSQERTFQFSTEWIADAHE